MFFFLGPVFRNIFSVSFQILKLLIIPNTLVIQLDIFLRRALNFGFLMQVPSLTEMINIGNRRLWNEIVKHLTRPLYRLFHDKHAVRDNITLFFCWLRQNMPFLNLFYNPFILSHPFVRIALWLFCYTSFNYKNKRMFFN